MRFRTHKYNAKPVQIANVRFDSTIEYKRYLDLVLMQENGMVTVLERQVVLKLEVNGVLICKIIPDFRYVLDGKTIIEDVKGFQTRDWKIKWRLAQALYPQYEFRVWPEPKPRKRRQSKCSK